MIGIFGGTFDPIHNGHLRSALEVKELFNLREVRLIPCANPPHRAQPLTSAEQRAEMLKLALINTPDLICDTRELQRTSFSYTIDTLKSLQQELSKETLILFIGSDAFAQLTHWYQWQDLFNYAHIVVLTRPDSEAIINFGHEQDFFNTRQTQHIHDLKQKKTGLLYFQHVTPLSISATAIRQLIANKRNPRFLLPDAVLDYINKHKLYQTF